MCNLLLKTLTCSQFVSQLYSQEFWFALFTLNKSGHWVSKLTSDNLKVVSCRNHCSQLIRGWLCDHGHMDLCYAAPFRSPLQNFTDSAKGFPSTNKSKEPFRFSGFKMTHGFVIPKALFARKECLSRLYIYVIVCIYISSFVHFVFSWIKWLHIYRRR